jgi:hypothetical protein
MTPVKVLLMVTPSKIISGVSLKMTSVNWAIMFVLIFVQVITTSPLGRKLGVQND